MSEQSEWATCSQEGCDIPAHVTYWWPGKEPAHACVIHAQGIKNVANACGFHVPMQPYARMDVSR